MLVSPSSLSAQTLSLHGTVADAQNAGVSDVTVTLTTAAASGRKKTTTGSDGKYEFTGLTAGNYTLVFDKGGYQTTTRSGSLTDAASGEVNITLPVAGVITTIDVTDVAGKATASRLDVPDRDLPFQVSSISRVLLDQQGVNDMVTALRNASGVQAQREYGVYEYYTIRGFNAADVMLVDGLRLEGNRFNTQINNVESVEILKGPSSVLYGGSALGGAINIIRKKPQASRAYDLMYRGGRFNSHQVAGGATGPLVGHSLLYRADASYDYSDDWRDAGRKRLNVSPSLTWLMSERATVTVHQSFTNDHFNGDGGVPVSLITSPLYDPNRRFSTPQDFVHVKDSLTNLLFNMNLGKRWEFRDGFQLRRTSDEYFVTEFVDYTPGDTTVYREGLQFHHNRRPTLNQADIVGRFDVLKMHHTVLLGHEYQDFYTRTGTTAGDGDGCDCGYYANLIHANLLNGSNTNPTLDISTIVRYVYQDNRINAFYWQDQIDVTKKLKINIGGRFDDYNRSARREYLTDPTRTGPTPSQTLGQNAYTYRAGIVYNVIGNHQVYFNAASSFTPLNAIIPTGVPLKPQSGHSFEIGHRWQGLNGRLKTSIALYDTKLTNVTYLTLTTVQQAGQQSSRGVDVDITGDLGHNVYLTANYGFTQPKFDKFYDTDDEADYSGNRPRFTQKHAANVWLSKGWKNSSNGRSGLTTSIGMRYLSSMFTNNANDTRLGGWTTFTGAVSYRRGKVEYALNAENLFNRQRYFTGADYSQQVYPGPPINVFGTVRLRFN